MAEQPELTPDLGGTSQELGRRAASSSASKASRPGPTRDVHVVDLESRLRRELQTKVRIVGRRDRGRIELHFYGEPELDRLVSRLVEDEA